MSEIVRQGQRLADFGKLLIDSIEAAGGSDENALRVFKDEQLKRQLGQLVMGQLKLAQPIGFSTTYDQSLGLTKLIELAVGERNLGNINSDITQERFPLKGTDVRKMNLRVEPYLNNETREQAARRLVAAGHILANTGDLAGFLHDHPKEVEKWGWVDAISNDSRWSDPDGDVYVPYAHVDGAFRSFHLVDFRLHLDSYYGVLVLCE